MAKIASRKPRSYQSACRQAALSRPAQPERTTAASNQNLMPGQHGRAPRIPVSALLGLDAGGAREVLVDARHALDLALGGEALVEAFLAELARHFRPGPEALLPALQAAGFRLGIVAREIGAHSHHRLDGHRLGDHVIVLAPHGLAEYGARRLEEVADEGVIARHFLGAAASELDRT